MLRFSVATATTFDVPARPYVLLVDDHGPSLCKLREVVELDGHAAFCAGSAAEAVRACDVRPPQVVITDLAMPNLDGRGLARWVKARFPSIPLILVTGEALDEEALAGLGQTFTAVFRKPIDVGALLERLARLMPAASLRRTATGRP